MLTVVFDWTVLVQIDTEHSKFQLVSDPFLNEFWSCNLTLECKFFVVSVVLHKQSLSYGMHLAFITRAIMSRVIWSACCFKHRACQLFWRHCRPINHWCLTLWPAGKACAGMVYMLFLFGFIRIFCVVKSVTTMLTVMCTCSPTTYESSEIGCIQI